MNKEPVESASSPAAVNTYDVVRVIRKAQDVLLQTQLPNGAWRSPDDLGPAAVAQVAVSLRFLGMLEPKEAADILAQLTARQRADGSFVAYPFAENGELCATAMCWAALRAAGLTEDDDRVRRAHAWFDANGGDAAVVEAMKQGDASALSLAMVGILDPDKLLEPPLFFGLVPMLERFLEQRFNPGLVMMVMQVGVLVRYLRGTWGPLGDHKGFIASSECERCLELLDAFQNDSGDWNGTTPQTCLALATLHAMGIPGDDPRVGRGVAWLQRKLDRGSDGIPFSAFGSGVWTAAFAVRALLQSGLGRSHPVIARAVSWILSCQIDVPNPVVGEVPDGPRIGGWGFQRTNRTMPDTDDTAVVLGALGLALDASQIVNGIPDALQPDLAEQVRIAVEVASKWLCGMHNRDGGFAAFEVGFPGQKTREPMMTHPIPFPKTIPEAVRFVLEPPVEVGDPSTADVTARVLYGLAQVGRSPTSSEVTRSITFLKSLQLSSGAYWGRWMVNYLPATAFVLTGLRAVGHDMKAHWVRRAVSFLLEHQNPDGGWGEDVATYKDPSLAGQGHSMPPLTGIVLIGLIDAGEGKSEAVARGVRYLLAEQRGDGTWPNAGWLHVFVAPSYLPSSFYYLPMTTRYFPLEALGHYLQDRAGLLNVPRGGVTVASIQRSESGLGDHDQTPPSSAAPPPSLTPRLPDGAWNDHYLQSMRLIGDAEGDDVVRQIFHEGSTKLVNNMLTRLLRADDDVPPELPDRVEEYFKRTATLPPWADQAQIALAQKVFVRCGWATAAVLFCSSLPQSYCAANGARVLHATQRIEAQVYRRILETAQFIFDVMSEGALGPAGHGIRAIQKVRLMHASTRQLMLKEARWDMAWGVPINQEDLAGTLMTFSSIVLNGFVRLGQDITAEEAEAWLHTWKVIGHVLGVIDVLLPRDVRDGDALMDAIRRLQWAPSVEGVALAKALVDSMQSFIVAPGMKGIPVALIRYLAGDRCGDLLGLHQSDWTHLLIDVTADIEELLGQGDRTSRVSALLSHAAFELMRGIVEVQRPNRSVKFRISANLTEAWNLGR